jgi:ribosomal protein L11 methyltransferase
VTEPASGGADELVRPVRVVRLTVDRADADLAAADLWLGGPSAVHEELLPDGRVRLTADPADLAQIGRWAPEVLEVDGAAHLDAWRAWARPVRLGERIVLQPPWVPAAPTEPGDVVVVLDPGRAFGSGSHPSTRLVLTRVEELVTGGEQVLDVGCGSGVLGVVALLLGAERLVAVDVDPAAVEATTAVAAANGVGGRVRVSTDPVAEVGGAFELVVANIGAGVLVELAPSITARVAPGGHVVLAGLLDADAARVQEAYRRHGLTVVHRIDDDGWACLTLAADPGPAPSQDSRSPT